MTDQKNTILAIALSALVLIAWQYFVGLPQMEKQKQEALLKHFRETIDELEARWPACVTSFIAVVRPNVVSSVISWPRAIPSTESCRGCQSVP